MDMSFYGGKQGKSFRIAKVFSNKAEMIEDLKAGWYSEIGMNELVFINYGSPSDGTIFLKKGDTIKINGQEFTADEDLTFWQTNRLIDANYKMAIKNEETGNYETKADGKLYNTTIWQKCYKDDYISVNGAPQPIPVKSNGKTEVNSMDKYVISDDYGIGYYLVASLTGSTPIVSAESEWIPTDNKPSVSVKYNENDIENAVFDFDLPKGVSFLYGTELRDRIWDDQKNLLPVTIKLGNVANLGDGIEFGTGDYYINTYNGNLWKCIEVMEDEETKEKSYTFIYVATFARWLDNVNVTATSPYKQENSKWTQNLPTGKTEIDDSHWDINFEIPKAPLLAVAKDLNLIGADEAKKAAITGEITDKDTYTLSFSIPKSSTWYAGETLNGEYDQDKLVLPGDFFLETTTYNIYKLTEKNGWELVGNIKGATGATAAINIIDYFTYIYKDSSTVKTDTRIYEGNLDIENINDLTSFGAIAEQIVGRDLKSNELISLIYNKNDSDSSYWLFKTENGGWDAMRVSGNASATTKNIVTINNDIVSQGGEFSVVNIGKTIDNTSKLDFQVNIDEDTLFDEVFSNMQKQINDSKQSIEDFKNTIIDIAHGGTGATTAEQARANLDVYSKKDVQDQVEILTNYCNELNVKASAATSKWDFITIPLKSSSSNATWSTTSDNKVQVVFKNSGTKLSAIDDTDQPIVICTDKNNEEYSIIESISFDVNYTTIIMTKENTKKINLFVLIPR